MSTVVQNDGNWERHESRVPIAAPAILISIGLLFLLSNLNVVSIGVWEFVLRFWPLALVLVGIEIVVNRLRLWPNFVNVLVAFIAIGAIVGLALSVAPGYEYTSGYHWGVPGVISAGREVIGSVELDEPVGDATQAVVDLNLNAGDLSLTAMPVGSPSLVSGRASYGVNRQAPTHETSIRDGQAAFRMASRAPHGVSMFPLLPESNGEEWDLKLNPDVPMTLRLKLAAMRGVLDLSSLKMSDLEADIDAASVKVTVPANGRTSARLKCDVADVTVQVPDGVAARIRVNADVSGVTVDESRFPRRGSYFQSSDYESAANQLDLELDADVSAVRVI